ncbi:DUF3515 domain-containing protein [Micromonospora peucetia]|uniref:DUF3515 domain-containing protein n=1 Tax=Micromonospora peucetia TaxID=47871 RepID=A0A1C6U6D2_9ACTN|nr:DUF3515 family protein [Micromonospora peucetia]MCX4386157.1 DUF3515 domain-containing protein [Micromonospora peucetia]WSA33514.1 DUF3515 domain-containing protein [Micromonospora peucetia]SCL49630.1 Protein of unknown function (DUF3515) [Micromonospora peucetia]
MDKITDSPVTDSAQPDEAAPERPARDRTTRGAALVATLIALPITVLVGGLAFAQLSSNERAEPAATPSATATTAGPRSTAPVEMAAPALAERPATVCRALLSQLPATVNDLPQRPVTAGPEQNAAYGDPAVTVACGGAEPTVGETDDVWTVNRVCWHATEQADATVLTTLDRETAVTVRVPRSYGPALQWVSPISDTLVATVPSGAAPSGCQG